MMDTNVSFSCSHRTCTSYHCNDPSVPKSPGTARGSTGIQVGEERRTKSRGGHDAEERGDKVQSGERLPEKRRGA
eukprot:761043-Hanusia_phi.AAC.1